MKNLFTVTFLLLGLSAFGQAQKQSSASFGTANASQSFDSQGNYKWTNAATGAHGIIGTNSHIHAIDNNTNRFDFGTNNGGFTWQNGNSEIASNNGNFHITGSFYGHGTNLLDLDATKLTGMTFNQLSNTIAGQAGNANGNTWMISNNLPVQVPMPSGGSQSQYRQRVGGMLSSGLANGYYLYTWFGNVANSSDATGAGPTDPVTSYVGTNFVFEFSSIPGPGTNWSETIYTNGVSTGYGIYLRGDGIIKQTNAVGSCVFPAHGTTSIYSSLTNNPAAQAGHWTLELIPQ